MPPPSMPPSPPPPSPPPPPRQPPGHSEVIEILAALGDRAPDQVAEEIGSLELAWLVSQVEERYGTTLDLDDEALWQMKTVSGAVTTIHQMLAGTEDG
jgi:acyl carrier protein